MAVPTLTPNSPSAGDIAWTAFHISYNGVTYSVAAGSTADTYTWWPYNSGAGGALQTSDTQPSLTPDDLLLFINKDGIPANVQASSLVDGSVIVDGSIIAAAIAAGTIEGANIAAGTLTSDLIAAGTIVAANIAAGAIGATQIAADAVTADSIAAGAIDGTSINGVTITGALIEATSGGVFTYESSATPINANPDFTSGIADWTATTGSISYAAPTFDSHDTMLISIVSGGLGVAVSESEAVTAGDSYLCDFITQSSGQTPGGGTQNTIGVEWFNSSGTLLSESVVASPPINQPAWTEYTAIVTAPAGAATMKLIVAAQSGSAGATFSVAKASIATDPVLIASVAPAAGTDRFGNDYKAGFTSYSTGGSWMQVSSDSGFPALLMNPASVTHITGNGNPQVFAAATNAGLPGEFNNCVITSGKNSDNDDAAIQLFAESADATIPAKAVIEFGGQVAAFILKDSGVVACEPGTAATVETWHDITVDSGWTPNSGQPPQYRLLPDGNVQVRGIATHAGTAAGVNINGSNPVPSGYRPDQARFYRTPMSQQAAGSVEISTAGVFVMLASGFSATQAILDGIYSI